MTTDIEIPIATRINAHHSEADSHANTAIEQAIIAGQLLTEAKNTVKHGGG